MKPCPECGTPETACEARYHECLALEFGDPGYGAVHHLTVAAYMLQHSSKLTRTGWLEMRQLLHAFLVENQAPVAIRQQNKDRLNSGKRQFQIKSKTGERIIAKSSWTKTICDVCTEDAERYRADVAEWARAALAESSGIEQAQ